VAAFPAIEPDGRSYDFGEFAMSEANGVGGGAQRFSHANTPLGHQLTLEYVERSEAEITLIRNHYRACQGSYLAFRLPGIIWRGHSTVATLVPVSGRWKYAGEPEEEHLRARIYNVSVPLQYVGPSFSS
jgi:hypothetical protein